MSNLTIGDDRADKKRLGVLLDWKPELEMELTFVGFFSCTIVFIGLVIPVCLPRVYTLIIVGKYSWKSLILF